MSDYKQDPDNEKKQVPGRLPENAFDQARVLHSGKLIKTPNQVYVNKAIAGAGVSFYFRDSASFASDVGNNGATVLTSASLYTSFGKPAIGTKLDIHPTAFSASNADTGSLTFIYYGGLSTGHR
jgi:hypothetical protein